MPKTNLLTTTSRRQVDDITAPWRSFVRTTPPRGGWLRMVREALGMTTRQMAQRLNTRQSRVVKIEMAEANGTTTLNTLSEAAHALGCDFVYAVVPRKPIRDILEERARDQARRTLQPTLHTMALESQSPSKEAEEELIKDRAQQLLAGNPHRLWDDRP